MEFDPTIQFRWKASFVCLGVGVAAFLAARVAGFGWHGLDWLLAFLSCSLGVFLALLSLLAHERRRALGWVALLLNAVVPGIVLYLLYVITFR
jgi:hypothetical protein